MSAAEAAEVLTGLRAAGVRCWVMGGWGVDALLGRVTRPHHDLDLLVDVADSASLRRWMVDHGFAWSYDWDETRWVTVDGVRTSTAFVAAHGDGRELDVHGIEVTAAGRPELATDDPWDLPPDTLTGQGSIAGIGVACVSRSAQLAMHRGYDLPAHHRRDLEALAAD